VNDRLDRRFVIKAVDTPDEFDIGRAPRRIWPHELLIFAHCQYHLWIVPGKRQMHDTSRHHHTVNRWQLPFDFAQCPKQGAARQAGAIIVNLQRANAGCHIDDRGQL
jgi:hypothetical protein